MTYDVQEFVSYLQTILEFKGSRGGAKPDHDKAVTRGEMFDELAKAIHEADIRCRQAAGDSGRFYAKSPLGFDRDKRDFETKWNTAFPEQ